MPRLVITARRATALGIAATTPVALQLAARDSADKILSLVAEIKDDRQLGCQAGGRGGCGGDPIGQNVARPACGAGGRRGGVKSIRNIIAVNAEAVARFRDDAMRSLAIASEASVPLNSGTRTRFVVFRDATGGSSVAIIVGKPGAADPVPVRLHSACLTGDVFGSRRCDCGDQLKLALARLEDLGGGVILYLAQEGRGLGLANKMRTYQMQDDGLDTVDANTTLGFDDDERDYGIAARMLQILGCTRIALLTNNPAKLDGLAKAGIDIVRRLPLEAPINADNRRYLTAKAARAGHHLDHLIASLADPTEPKQDVAPLAT